jgi:carbamoyltransferase
MVILGISWGVTSTAALMVDGRIVACVSEERFNRIKNYDGYPARAIEECLRLAGLSARDVDHVAWAGTLGLDPDYFLTHRYCRFSVADFIREQEGYWQPRLYRGEDPRFLDLFPEKIDLDQFPGRDLLKPIRDEKSADRRYEMFLELRDRLPELHLGIPKEKNVFLNHHSCHAAYATNAMARGGGPLLVFTVDGSGDGENATVWVAEGQSTRKLFGTDQFILGRLYRHATLLLGMKMVEHEYKVMGLAPYAKPFHSDGPYQVYAGTMQVQGRDVVFKEKPPDSYFHFKEKLKACRFDGIAGGLQRYLEDQICAWFANWMDHTGIRAVAYSGGVSMNVKANLAVLQRCRPTEFLCPGSGSDESLAIGACYRLAAERGLPTHPLPNLYLGESVDSAEAARAVRKIEPADRYVVQENVASAHLARLLASGKILGRCAGRMEFGARALGNRSVLADARDPRAVRVINDKIKSRDFWMPFAPSILHDRRSDYLVRSDVADYSHMTVGAETTPLARKHLPAALHPADDSARPQLVRPEANPAYHELLSRYQESTGVGGLLNTSLNIHGYPIVRTAEDALDVLAKTDIDGMILADTLVLKKDRNPDPAPAG